MNRDLVLAYKEELIATVKVTGNLGGGNHDMMETILQRDNRRITKKGHRTLKGLT